MGTYNKYADLLLCSIRSSLMAGKAILDVYESGDFSTKHKKDRSPITKADLAAHSIISEELSVTSIPVFSEEGRNLDYGERKNLRRLWLVDPLDGTREFIKRDGEFTVNIALIEDSRPVTGVVYVPVSGQLYFACPGFGAYAMQVKNDVEVMRMDLEGLTGCASSLPAEKKTGGNLTVVVSRSHTNPATMRFIRKMKKSFGKVDLISKGSALKICLVAGGEADIYPRFGPTFEWDSAAGHAVARLSGCRVLQHGSQGELMYNKEDLLNPWFIVFRETGPLNEQWIMNHQ